MKHPAWGVESTRPGGVSDCIYKVCFSSTSHSSTERPSHLHSIPVSTMMIDSAIPRANGCHVTAESSRPIDSIPPVCLGHNVPEVTKLA
jgi:hypothetical protein